MRTQSVSSVILSYATYQLFVLLVRQVPDFGPIFFSDVLIKGWTVDAEDTEDSDKRREINDRIRRLRAKLKTSMNKSPNLEPAEVKV